MAEFVSADYYTSLILVDRACLGGCEIIHDGVRITFPKGVIERPVPQFLAEWLFQVDQQKVHTTDGQFVQRFAVKDATEDFMTRAGREAGDCTPIEIAHRLEGWNVDAYALDRGNTRVMQIAKRPEEFANVGSWSTFAKEK